MELTPAARACMWTGISFWRSPALWMMTRLSTSGKSWGKYAANARMAARFMPQKPDVVSVWRSRVTAVTAAA